MDGMGDEYGHSIPSSWDPVGGPLGLLVKWSDLLLGAMGDNGVFFYKYTPVK